MPAAASEGVAFACKEDRLHQKCATKLLKSHSTKLRPIGNNWFGPQEYNTAAACHIATRLLVTSNTATPHGELKVSLAPLELFLLLPGKKIGTQQGTSSSKNSNPNEYSAILWHTLLSVAVRAIDMRIHDLTCLDCRSKIGHKSLPLHLLLLHAVLLTLSAEERVALTAHNQNHL